ncbi:hypothetical protein CVV68_09540 [Arthrobacter livingstonensis]|uniref:Uncharacterized protein n=1 Tax=Arthrobacter livingstonensis TaxID=670078 RepID=A0A2V5LYQ4_9MICC|nr:hypothetical protein CVV68_09540 [Arthrobacter livingstonensis]
MGGLHDAGQSIKGLYAAEIDLTPDMGGHYPTDGINPGPALTFGHITGRDLANATHYEDDGGTAPTKARPCQSGSAPPLGSSHDYRRHHLPYPQVGPP